MYMQDIFKVYYFCALKSNSISIHRKYRKRLCTPHPHDQKFRLILRSHLLQISDIFQFSQIYYILQISTFIKISQMSQKQWLLKHWQWGQKWMLCIDSCDSSYSINHSDIDDSCDSSYRNDQSDRSKRKYNNDSIDISYHMCTFYIHGTGFWPLKNG